MDRENIQPRSSEQQKGAPIIDLKDNEDLKEQITYEREDRVEVEIREIIRIKPQDFAALKNSFEDWASKWEQK